MKHPVWPNCWANPVSNTLEYIVYMGPEFNLYNILNNASLRYALNPHWKCCGCCKRSLIKYSEKFQLQSNWVALKWLGRIWFGSIKETFCFLTASIRGFETFAKSKINVTMYLKLKITKYGIQWQWGQRKELSGKLIGCVDFSSESTIWKMN